MILCKPLESADLRLPVPIRQTGVGNDRDEDRDEDGGATRIGTMIETKMGTEICAGGPTSASAVQDLEAWSAHAEARAV
jgi:hypothetical protein